MLKKSGTERHPHASNHILGLQRTGYILHQFISCPFVLVQYKFGLYFTVAVNLKLKTYKYQK